MTRSFSSHETVLESVRNLWANRVSMAVTMVILFLAAGGVAMVTHAQAMSSIDAWNRQRLAGNNVLSLRATNNAPMAAAQCDKVRSISGVVSAGGVLSIKEVRPAQDPSSTFLAVAVTEGFPAIAFPAEEAVSSGSVIAGSSLVKDLGFAEGTNAGTEATVPFELPIDFAVHSGARIEQFDESVMVVVPPIGSVTECLVEASPGTLDSVRAALVDWFPQEGVQTTDFLRSSDLQRNPASEIRSRSSQWLAVIVGATVAAMTLLRWRSRRVEFGVYLALRMPKLSLLILLVVESALSIWLPAAAGLLGALIFTSPISEQLGVTAIAADSAVLGLSLAVIPVLGFVLLTRMNSYEISKGH